MRTGDLAEERLRTGDLSGALEALQDDVRTRPNDASLRIFLFQLLSLQGDWERAQGQLAVVASLDPAARDLADTYLEAIRCEMVRADVFAGRAAPELGPDAPAWMTDLTHALRLDAHGAVAEAARLRQQAFEQAPASAGTIDGRPFTWIADADSRLGPVLEAIVDGRYRWIAWNDVQALGLAKPADLRDLIWLPAHLSMTSGADVTALLPARYAGSAGAADVAVVLGRKTVWNEVSPDTFHGLGQRIVATDSEELPLLEIRRITIDPSKPDVASRSEAHA